MFELRIFCLYKVKATLQNNKKKSWNVYKLLQAKILSNQMLFYLIINQHV